MLNRYIVRFLCVASAAIMLTSCGDSKATGTGEFATVFATANALVSVLDSDVATWTDATTGAKAAACGANSVATITQDNMVLNVTSSAYSVPNTGSSSPTVPSALSISNVTLTFTPADSNTPALPARFQTQFTSASPSVITVGLNPITLEIVTDEMKSFLGSALECTGALYTYRVGVSFDVVEQSTNKSGTISLPANGYLLIHMADFGDK